MSEKSDFLYAGASITGSNHIRNNLPCQDSWNIVSINGGIIAAVADGHGSDVCKHSDLGSKQAVDTFTKYFSELFPEIIDPISFHSYLSRNRNDILPIKICQDWEKEIKLVHERNGFSETFDPILYGSTLLGIVILPNYYFAFQLGDGDILSVDKNNGSNWIIKSDKILGTETHSLSSKEAWKNVKTEIVFCADDKQFPDLIILATDGLSNSFISDSGFLSSGDDYLNLINDHGFKTISEKLPIWLEEITTNGSGDDITVALIKRNY